MAPVVVGISGDDVAGVGAGGEAAVVGVGVGQPLAVVVGLGEENTRGFIVTPYGGVVHVGGLIAVGLHGGLVAKDIVGVAHGIGGAALVGLVAAQVVFIDRHIAEGVGDGDGLPHHVVTVGRDGADGVGDGDEVVLRVVSVGGAVVAAINGGHAAVERIVLKTVGHTGRIHRLDQRRSAQSRDLSAKDKP